MKHITEAEARKKVSEMNLINGFLFDSAIENIDDAKIILGAILRTIYNREFNIVEIKNQMSLQALDTGFHGIRFDAHITESSDGSNPIVSIYDIEMEDRPADKKYLPKRLRYYGALHDVKKLDSGKNYDNLPDFVSITILSYDPFDSGDMYYEAKTVLCTHPGIEYKDGLTHIYLYCNGKPNFNSPSSPIKMSASHSKRLIEMLKYIVSGEKPAITNNDIDMIDDIVTKVKHRKEVTTAYMRQWDRELSIKREEKQNNALKLIRFCRKMGVSDDAIKANLREDYDYNNDTIQELFDEIDTEQKISTIN